MTSVIGLDREGSGQALVEFAIAVPLFLLLTLGIFDLGRAVWYSNTLAYATEEGARYGIVNGSTAANSSGLTRSQVVDAVKSVVVRKATGVTGLTTGQVSVTYPDDPSWSSGARVKVSISGLTFTPVASQYFLAGALRVDLSASTTMVIRY